MKTIFTLLTGLCSATVALAQFTPETINGRLVRIADVHHPVPGWKDVKVRDERGIIRWNRENVENDEYEPPILFPGKESHDLSGPIQRSEHISVNAQLYPGMGYTSVCPADPSLAVGDSLIVQMINGGSGAYFTVYRKTTTGSNLNIAVSKKYLDGITGKGGLGDPIALYDFDKKYFILTEFANKKETGSDGLIIAVVPESDISKSNATFKSYFFPTSTFPDYPKFGINDGYLYGKTNDFRGNSYAGASAYVVKLDNLYNGTSNTSIPMTRFSLGTANRFYSMCPVTMVGRRKPNFTQGGLYAYLNPASWSGSNSDQVGFMELNPTASTMTDITSKTITSFSFPSSTTPQPSGDALDVLRYRIMNQPVARTLTDVQKIVVSFTVLNTNASSNTKPTFRWVEFTIPNSINSTSSSMQVSRQSSYLASDNNARFQPRINIDKNGRIGIVYNITNNNSQSPKYPSLNIIGIDSFRNTVTYTSNEGNIATGSASSVCYNRYGDYNHLVIDPADSIRFWATGMYNTSSSWSTAIGSFTIGPSSVSVNTSSQPSLSLIESSPDNAIAQLVHSVYPNPATDFLNISLKALVAESRIQLVNINGEVLQEVPVTGTLIQLNTNTLSPGAYFLRITQKGKTGYQKFIKQ